MDERKDTKINPTKYSTTVERKSDRELVVTRTFNGPAHIVFDAWTKPELLKRWWAPESCGLSFVSCETDVRTGGTYRFVFSHPCSEQPMSFFGRYLDVTPHSRIVWTNEESDEGGAVTTVIFEEKRCPHARRYPRPLSFKESSRRGAATPHKTQDCGCGQAFELRGYFDQARRATSASTA